MKARTEKRFRFWLLIISFLLFGASMFNAVDYVLQRERVALLYTNRDYYVLIQTYKEIERLINVLKDYFFQDPVGAIKHDELLLHFELVVSRVPLLTEGEVGKRVSAFPGVSQVAQELKESLLGLEPLVTELQPGNDSANYEAILWELQRHQDTLFNLSRQFLLRPGNDESVSWDDINGGIVYWHFASVVLSGLLLFALSLTQLRRDIKTSEARAKERHYLRRVKQQLSYQATHDALTGLINRSELERRLQRVYESARTQGDEGALLYLDLDRFKIVNDSCGHLAGDQLLRQIATLLRGRVRKRDTLARLGSDEFVALLEHCPLPKALQVAEDILDTVRDFRFAWENRAFALGVSIGIAPVTLGSESPAAVLMAADKACYTAKNAGRNCARIYMEDIPMTEWRDDQTLWVELIEKGLEDDRLCLYSQTICPLAMDENWGDHYEVFLRLEDEKGCMVLPEMFFSAAERYDLMTSLDRWVIRRTFNWLSESRIRLESLGLCFINLSADSLMDKGFCGFIIELLKNSKVPAEKVCFEISEEAAMSNLGAAIDLIRSLNQLGCHFALDDFGAGMSTFAYLKHLPVDFIKIDGGLVRDIIKDPVDRALVHAINEVGHLMGKRTIATFVETKAIREELRRMGVNFAQGYAIARPHPLEGVYLSAMGVG